MPGNNGEGHYFNQEIEMAKLPLSDIEVLTSRGFLRGPEPRSIWPISGRTIMIERAAKLDRRKLALNIRQISRVYIHRSITRLVIFVDRVPRLQARVDRRGATRHSICSYMCM
jgi:hypothetical protein